MSETVNNLVNAIKSKDAIGIETAFQAAMAEKISARLDDMRQDVAQRMFKTQEAEVAAEEPTVEIEEQ